MPGPLSKKFCKTAHCPSAEMLLRHRRQRLSTSAREGIDTHLKACDFCSAELQLLMRHRSSPEEYRLVEMPRQLRRLAEQVLARRAAFRSFPFDPDPQTH